MTPFEVFETHHYKIQQIISNFFNVFSVCLNSCPLRRFIGITYGFHGVAILSRFQLVFPSRGGSFYLCPRYPVPPARPVLLVILHLIIDFNVPLTFFDFSPAETKWPNVTWLMVNSSVTKRSWTAPKILALKLYLCDIFSD